MLVRIFAALYRWQGPRYPRLILWVQLQAALFVVAAGVGLLTVYQPLGDDFWVVLAVGELLIILENTLAYRVMSRMLTPVDAWLAGDRSEAAAVAAWRALAALPSRFTRTWKVVPVFVSVIPFSAFTTIRLGLPWHSFIVLFLGGMVAVIYGLFLRFFAHELALRPVIEAVSRDLPDDFELGEAGISLRTRLLLSLPMLNIIAGVTVAGLSTTGTATLSDLGVDVGVAVVVAFTVSLELSVLLARSVVDPIMQLQRATDRMASGDLSVRVPVASTDETGRLAQSFNEALAGLQERRALLEAFGVYVDPDVAARVLAEGVALEGEEVEVSVLFLDVRGFTAMAEHSDARELVGRLNGLFEVVVPLIVEHGGHANKFVGDGLLAVFGAPDRLPDHADRALAAALAIVDAVRAAFGGDLEIGIGANSGPVIAGSIGGGRRYEFTVIGDPVNTAARGEEATRASGDALLVTAELRAQLSRDDGDWVERPDMELKGKTQPVTLYAPRACVREGGLRPA
jgi:class 3 adenylate cyclase